IVLDPAGTITGTVLSPEGDPVPNQKVRLILGDPNPGFPLANVRSTMTDDQGRYSYSGLAFGAYPITVKRGTEVANAMVNLSRTSPTINLDLQLRRPTGKISGWVEDETGLRVAARVNLSALGPNFLDWLSFDQTVSVISDPTSGFTFDGV